MIAKKDITLFLLAALKQLASSTTVESWYELTMPFQLLYLLFGLYLQIILLVTVATSLVAYSDSAAMFPFSFRIPMSANDAKDVSSVIMVPAVGPISSDSKILRGLFDGFSFWAASQTVSAPLSHFMNASVTLTICIRRILTRLANRRAQVQRARWLVQPHHLPMIS